MSIFRCKMCGGTIEFEPGATVGVCDSCGTKQTLPRLDDDRRANLYDRANHFRRNNEYDKAAGLYEQILNEDNTDAEAYWSLVLCRYGIEYVEDPATHKRVPTVNRAQYTSIFDDDNYRSALQYADGYQKSIYEEEATAINEIQKGILAISQKEQPFDVFICYKETDDSGRRTQDSVLANDLYHQLTQEGFKVFFSRITLEDKLGTAYEPYIFAALNSAKVMVALGTKPAYFNAVWVKNEWSRYLALVKESGGKKTLIPAYRDMDPYDLPEEFSHLQALDMSKLGFMQDLIRGIKKIVNADESKSMVKETVVVSGSGTDVEPLLERAFLFLEDGNFSGADEYCERVLDQAPKNAQAYLGKLMVEQKVRHQENLADCAQPFDNSDNYQKALRFGDEDLVSNLKRYIDQINVRIESARKDAVYAAAEAKMAGDKTGPYEKAVEEFRSISGWKDANEKIVLCQKKIEEIKLREEQDRIEKERKKEEARIAREQAAKKTKKILAIVIPVVCVCIVVAMVMTNVVLQKQKVNRVLEAINGASVGDIVTFGTYHDQDITWLVLAKDNNRLLVISEYALDCQPFNTTQNETAGIWETCSLRTWLNSTFLTTAFTAEEQARIPTVTVTANANTSYSTDTQDQLFLLSSREVNSYFSSDSARQCKPTDYAKSQGCQGFALSDDGFCSWWLRSAGSFLSRAAYVDKGGSVNLGGVGVDYDHHAIRPAMWIDLDS